MPDEEHALGFHEGEALYALATTYPTLRLCLVEGIQNAIDAKATCVYVGVDLVERRVAICDNGEGVTVEKFRKALQSIGKGIKSKDALGRFGRGLIASIHLAQTMTFLSRPRDSRMVNNWLFVGESLKKQHRGLKIPFSQLSDFPQLPEPFTRSHKEAKPHVKSRITWRTMLLLDRVTSDQTITLIDLDDLEHLIRTKLGQGMRRNGTTVFLKVRDAGGRITKRKIDPSAPSGERLEPVVYNANSAGEIEFELYRARMRGGKRAGEVVVMRVNDVSTVSLQELRTQAMGARWYSKDKHLAEIKNGMDALCSGYFEGFIRVERLELAPARDKFKLDDALTDTFALIGEWYEKVGSTLMYDAREEQEGKRYQELGSQSLERLIQELQTNPALAHLAHDLRGVLPVARTSRPERTASERSEQRTQRPAGERRVFVQPKQRPEASSGSPVSSFITLAYDRLKGSTRLWEYEPESGVLTFNIRHPVWVKVDDPGGKRSLKQDKRVMELQEWLMFKLLLLLTDHSDSADIELHRSTIDREVEYYVEMFILRG